MPKTHPSICRFCHASCPILVDVEDGRAVHVRGDRDNPIYHGYVCPKGRALPDQHAHPERLLHSLVRRADGSQAPIASGQAVTEVAERVQAILDAHGPRAIATYNGTFSFGYPASVPMAMAWMDAIRSPMRFTSATIDQPGKMVAAALHGGWGAGAHPWEGADTWLLVGANPAVSKSIGVPCYNPAWYLDDAIRRGMKLVVIDPRRSDAARLAEVERNHGHVLLDLGRRDGTPIAVRGAKVFQGAVQARAGRDDALCVHVMDAGIRGAQGRVTEALLHVHDVGPARELRHLSGLA